MAVRNERGTEIITAVQVTHRVPIINGKNPNSPFKGCHESRKKRSARDFMARMYLDLWNKAKPIRMTSRMQNMAENHIMERARLSLNNLLLFILKSAFSNRNPWNY